MKTLAEVARLVADALLDSDDILSANLPWGDAQAAQCVEVTVRGDARTFELMIERP